MEKKNDAVSAIISKIGEIGEGGGAKEAERQSVPRGTDRRQWESLSLLSCCFTSTEARWLIRDGDSRSGKETRE